MKRRTPAALPAAPQGSGTAHRARAPPSHPALLLSSSRSRARPARGRRPVARVACAACSRGSRWPEPQNYSKSRPLAPTSSRIARFVARHGAPAPCVEIVFALLYLKVRTKFHGNRGEGGQVASSTVHACSPAKPCQEVSSLSPASDQPWSMAYELSLTLAGRFSKQRQRKFRPAAELSDSVRRGQSRGGPHFPPPWNQEAVNRSVRLGILKWFH